MKTKLLLERVPAIPYVLPFVLFLGLTALDSHLPGGPLGIYPLKTLVTAFLLWHFRKDYVELKATPPPFEGYQPAALTGLIGFGVFLFWILPEGRYPLLSPAEAWNPYEHVAPPGVYLWIAFRLLGAVVVVPIMEELFWRAFLIRYLIHADFRSVPLGSFTWFSFVATVLLFGVEHHRWLPGIVAGILYNLLLYRTKRLVPCIWAHALTNLTLGIYVLITRQWGYW